MPKPFRFSMPLFALLAMLAPIGCLAEKPASNAEAGWVELFDGKTLGKWKSTAFGGEGEVRVENGAVILPMGDNMSGITWTGEVLHRMNYEIEVEARRTVGNDFFCGLTFPFNDSHCTLICSGWGGSVLGLSTLGGYDASENDSSTFFPFKNDVWYRIRLRVEPDNMKVWVDGKQKIDVALYDRKVDIRPEVMLSRPLGISTWTTEGQIRAIRWRAIPKSE